MPRGTRYALIGQLLERDRQLYLRCDDGGEWRLDAPARARGILGRRVRVEGVRDGYDLLAVEWIGRPGEERRPEPFVRSRQFAAGAASALLLVAGAVVAAARLAS